MCDLHHRLGLECAQTSDKHRRLEQRVRDNVKLIKDSPFIREELKARTKGLIYDIKTGALTELR
jgi:carbonic anhydrase